MRKILLASAGVIAMTAGMAYAACIPTPSCSSLGYESSSSCEGGIKCPFGNAWNCTLVNKITEIEKIIQESGASGSKGDTSNCVVGSIFYSDWTCSYGAVLPTKIPIGVVAYSDGIGHGQVMALKSIGSYKWGPTETNVPGLTNFKDSEAAAQDLASCSNTEKILTAGDKNTYPAAWAAHEYKTEGTNVGDWCLPAAGVFASYYEYRQLINTNMTNVGGTQIEDGLYDYWSSSVYSDGAWRSEFLPNKGNGLFGDLKRYSLGVRPVLEF